MSAATAEATADATASAANKLKEKNAVVSRKH